MKTALLLILLFMVSPHGIRADDGTGAASAVPRAISGEISKAFPGARIVLLGALPPPASGFTGDNLQSVALLQENGRGQAWIRACAKQAACAEFGVAFSAFVPAKIALRRIHPGERIADSDFKTQEVDVALGQSHEFRGVLFPAGSGIDSLEAAQTVLEGQFLTTAAVRKVPDVRRGDAVRIQLISGDIVLTAHGIAQEPAYLNGQVRVITDRTKRELVGSLQPDGIVEVRL